MSMGTLAKVAEVTGGRLRGADAAFDSVSTDSRSTGPGQLFFALRGHRHDGERFLPEARQRGAVGAVVSRLQPLDWPQVTVSSTREALGRWAAYWRSRFRLPVIGVTGSNGKTTVKEMIAAILRVRHGDAVLATRGNLNNDVGLPLMVLDLGPGHRSAVLEMGASQVGDIAWLAGVARPTVGVVTNAGEAHLEGFGSRERIARGKGEIFAGLAPDGIAVINRDQPWYPLWTQLAGSRQQLSFGLAAEADVRAAGIESSAGTQRFTLCAPAGSILVTLPMAGAHNVANALAAAAATLAAGATLDEVASGLGSVANVAGRLRARPGRHGGTVYDDSYNANPGSMAAAIDFLAALPAPRWLVLGDMAELGPDSAAFHRALGEQARARGIDGLHCIGPRSRAIAEGFGPGACWHATLPELLAALDATLPAGAAVLVKASRSMGLERVVARLMPEQQAGTG